MSPSGVNDLQHVISMTVAVVCGDQTDAVASVCRVGNETDMDITIRSARESFCQAMNSLGIFALAGNA